VCEYYKGSLTLFVCNPASGIKMKKFILINYLYTYIYIYIVVDIETDLVFVYCINLSVLQKGKKHLRSKRFQRVLFSHLLLYHN